MPLDGAGPSLLITGTFLWNLVAMEGEVRVFLHNTWWLLYLDIWYLLYSISMQSCADYLDSFHGCIRICLLASGQSCLAVSHCSSALGHVWKGRRLLIFSLALTLRRWFYGDNSHCSVLEEGETWEVIKIETRCIFIKTYLRLDHRNSWSS